MAELVLRIESSCVRDGRGAGARGTARSTPSIVHSQLAEHALFGGVVPEVAAARTCAISSRSSTRRCSRAGVELGDVDAVAVTTRPA
jgi:N6-L-threonylcarbamoyladenine synthase